MTRKSKTIFLYLFTIVLLVSLVGGLGGCSQNTVPTQDEDADDQAEEPQGGEDMQDTQNAASANTVPEEWQLMPMVSKEQKNAGIEGGEGGQWEQGIACDPVEGSFLLSGTDVGGVFRSLDGGKHWEPANVGYYSRGNSGFAIDPNNIDRVLAVGANSGPGDANGLYLSTDRAATWTHVLPAPISGYRDFREQVAFDKSSYDEEIGGSRIAYWSRIGELDSHGHWGDTQSQPALYKSEDGGNTWTIINSSFGDSIVKVHPTKGLVYTANKNGFYISRDGGKTFEQKLQGAVKGLDVVYNQPDYVFINKDDGVYVSTDSGESFTKKQSTGFPAGASQNPVNLKVSPADINRMLVCKQTDDYNRQAFYTTDGGDTWHKSSMDTTKNFLPFNNRQLMFAWHPTDANQVWTFGGDWVSKSEDGGASFAWDNNGNTGILAGGKWNFNAQNPDILYFGSQDYNGALTTDGGDTWEYINMSQLSWGGFCYGGYAADEKTIFVGVSDGWSGDRILKITWDGGKTVTDTGLVFKGPDVSYGDPTNPDILFASNYRSTDKGKTWADMKGCDGVVTHNFGNPQELYGLNGDEVVVSTDHGATWKRATTFPFPKNVEDAAYDHVNDKLYVVTGDKLYMRDHEGKINDLTPSIPGNQYGERVLKTVAIDPQQPDIVYVGGSANVYYNDSGVMRSTDGGATWEVLTRNTRNSVIQSGIAGGNEPSHIRVHPKTRELYVSGGCYGWSKIGPPVEEKK